MDPETFIHKSHLSDQVRFLYVATQMVSEWGLAPKWLAEESK